jgi:hypothetical protein
MQGFEAPIARAVLDRPSLRLFFESGRYQPAAMFNSVQEKTKCFLAELPPDRNYGTFEEGMQPFLSGKSDLSAGQDV